MDLDTLGTFFGTLGTTIATDYKALNPTRPVVYQPAYQLPQSSAVPFGSSSFSGLLPMLVVVGGVVLLVKFFGRAA